MEIEHSFINKPNLQNAKIITIIALASQFLILDFFLELIGLAWIGKSGLAKILIILTTAASYYLFSQYLKNFKFGKKIFIFYASFTLIIFDYIAGYITDILNQFDLNIAQNIYFLHIPILGIVSIVLFYLAGVNLIKYKEDFVGGLNIVGILFTMKGTLMVLIAAFTIASIASSATSGSLVLATGLLSFAMNIFIFTSMIYIYSKAQRSNDENEDGGEDPMLKKIEEIGKN